MFAVSVQAQDSNKMQYLLNGDIKVSGFGGPIVEFSSLKGELAVSNGGGGAVLLNDKFFVGGYGLGVSNRIQIDLDNLENARLNFGHGGIWMGYIHKSKELIHFGGSLKVGWGNTELRGFSNNSPSNSISSDNVFVLNPQGEIELNITRWFKLNAAVGYRAVTGLNNDYLKSADLSSLNFSLGFLFGWYGRS